MFFHPFLRNSNEKQFSSPKPNDCIGKESKRKSKSATSQSSNKKQSFERKMIEGTTYSSITNMYLFTSSEICIAVSSSSISLRLTENNKQVSTLFPGNRKYC